MLALETDTEAEKYVIYRNDLALCLGGRGRWIVRHKESLIDLIGLQANFSDVTVI